MYLIPQISTGSTKSQNEPLHVFYFWVQNKGTIQLKLIFKDKLKWENNIDSAQHFSDEFSTNVY